jgi:hypothetical protein
MVRSYIDKFRDISMVLLDISKAKPDRLSCGLKMKDSQRYCSRLESGPLKLLVSGVG